MTNKMDQLDKTADLAALCDINPTNRSIIGVIKDFAHITRRTNKTPEIGNLILTPLNLAKNPSIVLENNKENT